MYVFGARLEPVPGLFVSKASAKLGMCQQHVLVFYCGGKSPKAELLHHPGLKNAMRPQAWA